MGTRVHYAEEVKWEVIKMKQAGMTNKEIMEQLGIKNKTQIKTWMRWYKTGQTYRFSQQVGKQYSYGKESEEMSELEELKLKNKQLEAQLAIIKKVPGDRKELEPRVIVQVVEELSATFKIIDILGVLGIPKSTYYRWKKKYKKVELTSLEELVIKLCKKNFYHYGHRKIKSILNRKYGINVNRKTVQKIMQKFEIQCQVKKKRQKYICGESNIIVPNTLNRNFKASRLNEKWVTDITYLPYGSTMLYLSTIMDLYNNEIVAYKIGTSQDINLVLDILREAVELRKPVGLLLHSDQGSVYTSHAYQNLAKEKGITTSMSRKGNCHDNAVIESFHSSLKSEGFNAQSRASISNSKVVQIVNQYMYRYNHVRIQAKLNYLSPLEYRGQAA
ncbi:MULTISPECIES: IS3 family transposase [Bacillus]|uniref:IS3 family transposase n=1 Tax=Bacillus TaxID=1386 RepID=UPI0011A85ACE|nr:IS3 family transposase [Bacillus licheniformis]MEC1495537.1 IS3 family transposase [Bacillus licheniformis]WCO62386.1 IS3 family transposase [Bacillus licheniformis]